LDEKRGSPAVLGEHTTVREQVERYCNAEKQKKGDAMNPLIRKLIPLLSGTPISQINAGCGKEKG
jgi:hypothetical protein